MRSCLSADVSNLLHINIFYFGIALANTLRN